MLLVVAGMRSWSDSAGLAKKYSLEHKSVSNDITQGNPTLPEGDQAKVSTLSLNAVITPAISFDFSHYFYFHLKNLFFSSLTSAEFSGSI
jgi:hypothetical protein